MEEKQYRTAQLTALIRTHFPADLQARILDLGCGAGVLLERAKELGYRDVRGVDRSPEQVAEARSAGLTEVVEGDALAHLTHLPAESLDCLVAFDVLEHVSKPELHAWMMAIHRALADEGRLILHLPNGASPLGGRVVHGDLTHETVFTGRSIAQLLAAYGFQKISCHEDRPVGAKARVRLRRLGWQLIRFLLRLAIAVETGDRDPQMVLTQTFYCVAVRGRSALPPPPSSATATEKPLL